MIESALVPLSEWESFYVIVGTSAAALTGLQFVVIALGAEARRLAGKDSVGAFATPTVVHFCAVLLLAAIQSAPGHSPTSLSVCLLASGSAGLSFTATVIRQARRQKGYAPVLEDWIWHTILPVIAYAALIVAGAMTWRHVVPALLVVGAVSVLLLFIGIHNAWDAAIWMVMRDAEESPAKEPEAGVTPRAASTSDSSA